jgi:hypothetical protein
MVVGSALTAALALGALPGLVGSSAPSVEKPIPAGAFRPLSAPATLDGAGAPAISGFDVRAASDGAVDEETAFVEPGEEPATAPPGRARTTPPGVSSRSARKPPKYTLTGEATFYDHGTTAMRLPRGTTVIVCGAGGCLERVVSDYGPQKESRIIDLYRPDFFEICGCESWEGVVDVTVHVY